MSEAAARTTTGAAAPARKRVAVIDAGVSGLCVAPDHCKPFDEPIDDIGARVRRRNSIAETFSPPDADAYAR